MPRKRIARGAVPTLAAFHGGAEKSYRLGRLSAAAHVSLAGMSGASADMPGSGDLTMTFSAATFPASPTAPVSHEAGGTLKQAMRTLVGGVTVITAGVGDE